MNIIFLKFFREVIAVFLLDIEVSDGYIDKTHLYNISLGRVIRTYRIDSLL